jgi:hypothetical protein
MNRTRLPAIALAFAFMVLVAATIAWARGSAAPQNTAPPTITGVAREGRTLTATRGTWSNVPTSFAFQWRRCGTDGTGCSNIAGATRQTYTLTATDVDNTIRVVVTASNADGSATAASNATPTVTTSGSGRPRNTSRPSITGTPAPGSALHGDPGVWSGTQPIALTFTWLRCGPSGGSCVELQGQTADSYTLVNADLGHTLRFQVTAKNSEGERAAESPATPVVSAGAGLPAGAIKLASGEISIPASSVPASERLVLDRVDFSPNPVRSRSTSITIGIKVKDTRGYVVRDVLVFVRSTPLVTSTPPEQRTGTDGTVTYTVQPEADFPIRKGYNVQFFVKAHRQGDNPLAGIAAYRLVQVATAP